MTRTQQQAVAIAVLAVIVVAVYRNALRPSAARSVEAPAPGVQQPPIDQANVRSAPLLERDASALRPAQRERARQLAWRRDPFLRAGGSAGLLGLALSGILWDPVDAIAIINGNMVHVGEECDGYRVVEIQPDRVSVSDGMSTYQLLTVP